MKWKLNIRKEVRVIVSLLGVSLLIAFTDREQSHVVCRNIVVQLGNTRENHFLDEADVMKMIETEDASLRGATVKHVDLKAIESRLRTEPHIQDAQLYCDLKGDLIARVELQRPVARIVQEDAPDAYITEGGTVMPVSDRYTSRVMLVSGAFVKKILEHGDLTSWEDGKPVMDMIRMINDDEFWRAQVAQLDINRDGKIIIYPQVTGQRVEFGKPVDLKTKFRKLMIFYKEILPQRGWTRYERVNLEFEGQIVAE